MARVYSEFPLSGRHGNIVYYRRNGKVFMRVVTDQVDPETDAQLIERAKFRAASKFVSKFTDVVRKGYQAPIKYSSAHLEAKQYCIEHSLKVGTPTEEYRFVFDIDLPRFKISRGQISVPDINFSERTGNKISLKWNTKLGRTPNKLYDNLNIVAYCPGKKILWINSIGTRATGQGEFMLPDRFDIQVHLWAFFSNEHNAISASQANISDSVYVGEFA